MFISYMDQTVTVTTSIISEREGYGRHDANIRYHSFAPYKSQCVTDPHARQLFSLKDFPGKYKAPCQPGEGRESTACTSLSCVSLLKLRVYRLCLCCQFILDHKRTFEVNLPKHPRLLCFSLQCRSTQSGSSTGETAPEVVLPEGN